MTVAVVVYTGDRERIPVRYSGWPEWRRERVKLLPAVPPAPITTTWCAMCWGQGRIREPVRRPRGELIGYQLVDCAYCEGRGKV